MTDININDIDRLLQRFFDGFTTIEEEKALERFYASSPRLPRRLERYRSMFGWYASGMTAPLPSARPRPRAGGWGRGHTRPLPGFWTEHFERWNFP